MQYTKLPPVKNDKTLVLEHFPSRFHAAVFRLWETVSAEQIAKALNVSVDVVKKTADDMGLPGQKYTERWVKRGYITTIRNAWHILPYDQLLNLLGWTEAKLAAVLKDDDFFGVKLGEFKPYCETVKPEILNETQQAQLSLIKETVQKYFSDMLNGAPPFDFFEDKGDLQDFAQSDDLRMIYSYCGLYAGMLDNDISMSYPEDLLKMYKSAGINAIWLPVLLYQVVPFTFDESYSTGWEQRQERLRELVQTASKYGIKVYLYLNEPRCMPIDFFEKHSELRGRTDDMYAALCTSNPMVMQYLRNAVSQLCKAVPGIGGFFAITCSEYLTHCKSRKEGKECPVCKNVPIFKLVADVLCAISEESRKVNPDIRTIAWTWAWDDYMTKDEITKCIDLLPKEIIIQCNSEAKKEYTVGGITGSISDYSMSIPGPSDLAEFIWNYARQKGHEVCAKVQVNDTWECSTVPFLPVFDLLREHMLGLKNAGVKHLMLSWTLGGYPSVNLKVVSECLQDSRSSKYKELLEREFGEHAQSVEKAVSIFSKAFREFPFHIGTLYTGPQNSGPSNPLYYKPSGFNASMTCYAYDDLDSWRAMYPRDIYIGQLRKLSDGWREGLKEIENMPDCLFKQVSLGGYALFYSSYLQSEFIDKRNSGDKQYLLELVNEEKELALLMYSLMQKSSLFGYEAANHYYFNKGMLAEKVINCEYIAAKFEN